MKCSIYQWKCVCDFQGSPYPQQDQNAMDAVMQFAINKLGFLPEDIVLFGWSIGGYSSLVAAAQYPDIKGVVKAIPKLGYPFVSRIEFIQQFSTI